MTKTMAACESARKRTQAQLPHSAGLRLAALLVVLLASSQTQALVLPNAEAAIGQWDLSLDSSGRRCRVTLRSESAGAGHELGMPAGCRRALPILADVNTWSLPERDHLDLADSTGAPVLNFVVTGNEGLLARGPQGETYRFVAVALANQSARFISPDARSAPGFEPVQVATGAAKAARGAPSIKPSEVAGRYSILREGGKDTGCMLTLDDHSKGLGGNKAILAPACRDQGMVIFDPAGWEIVGGRLVLTARKGHKTHLDRQDDGTWTKDPQEGKQLILKRQ